MLWGGTGKCLFGGWLVRPNVRKLNVHPNKLKMWGAVMTSLKSDETMLPYQLLRSRILFHCQVKSYYWLVPSLLLPCIFLMTWRSITFSRSSILIRCSICTVFWSWFMHFCSRSCTYDFFLSRACWAETLFLSNLKARVEHSSLVPRQLYTMNKAKARTSLVPVYTINTCDFM